jgi:hypothetical protein
LLRHAMPLGVVELHDVALLLGYDFIMETPEEAKQ